MIFYSILTAAVDNSALEKEINNNSLIKSIKNDSVEKILDKLIVWCSCNGIKILLSILILLVGWKLINKLRKVFDKFAVNRNYDITLHTFLSAFLHLSLKALLIIGILEFLGIKLTGLAAILASSTLAIGLALQGSLSNFAGGVILLIMRPFTVGDYIKVQNYEGVVKKIEMFYTFMDTVDNKVVMIPNGSLANSDIINYSANNTRRVDLTFSIGYDDDLLKAKNIIKQVLESNDKILKDPESFIGVSELADSSVNFVVRAWTKTEDYWNVYFFLNENVKLKFDEEGINIPYPQVDVHMK